MKKTGLPAADGPAQLPGTSAPAVIRFHLGFALFFQVARSVKQKPTTEPTSRVYLQEPILAAFFIFNIFFFYSA